jgi:hypothetical protein
MYEVSVAGGGRRSFGVRHFNAAFWLAIHRQPYGGMNSAA